MKYENSKNEVLHHWSEPLQVILVVICFPIARVWGGKRHYACSTMSILSTEDRAALSTGSREERHEGPVPTQPRGQATLCLGPTQHLPSQQHHQQVVTLSLLWTVMVIACSMTNHPFTFLYLHASLAQPGWQCPCCWWSWQRSSVSLCLFLVKITAGYLPVHFPRASPSASSTRPRWTLWGFSLTTVRSRQSVIIHGENYF